jgi:hypothetical protein
MLTLAAIVLAQSGGDPTVQYINYGVLGITVVMFALGKFIPGVIYDRAEARHKAELEVRDKMIADRDEEIARLNLYIADSVIPAIIRFTDLQARQVERQLKSRTDE